MGKKSIYEKQIIKKKKTGLARLVQIAGTKKVFLFFAVFLSLVAVIAQMTPFVTVYLLVRELVSKIRGISSVDPLYVFKLGWITVAGFSAFGILTYAGSMLSHIAAFSILYEIRKSLAEKLARLPMGYFSKRSNGSIKKIMGEDVERIELFVAHHTVDISQAVFLPVISLAALFWFDWRLALSVLLPLVFAFIVQMSMYSKDGVDLFAQWQKKLSAMNGTIVEYVRGMPVVKIFNQSARAFKRFSDDVYAYRDLTLDWIKISATPYSAFLVLLSSCALFIIPVGVFIVLNSGKGNGYSTAVSSLFLFLYVGMGIAVPLYKLLRMSGYMRMVNSGVQEIDSLLDEKEMPNCINGNFPVDSSIAFSGVSFSYGNEIVINDVSFILPPKSVTALVGPSGGGKSTIVSLIGRFWDIKEGRILLGGIDIREMPVETLNNHVSTVFQDVFLFFDTIEENIRMGNDSASFEDVVRAAKTAQIHDFIESLSDKYSTKIGHGGVHLSGGEQQRISIARAILKNSPVILLDEATAYADPENESKIQVALSEVLKDKTVVIIAHRLYTITEADNILYIDKGRIAESGTHEELLSLNGSYAKMWRIHSRARNWEMEK